MCAAAVVRIIRDELVARQNLFQRITLENLVDRADHRAQVNGDALGKRNDLTLRIEYCRRTIARSLMLGENAVRCSVAPILFRGGEQITRNHFGFDRIDLACFLRCHSQHSLEVNGSSSRCK
jgi:hypothetical protein